MEARIVHTWTVEDSPRNFRVTHDGSSYVLEHEYSHGWHSYDGRYLSIATIFRVFGEEIDRLVHPPVADEESSVEDEQLYCVACCDAIAEGDRCGHCERELERDLVVATHLDSFPWE